jgi:hypothetical protein
MKRIVLVLCVFIALSFVTNAEGFYNCIDRDGNIIITDTPPPDAKCEFMVEQDKSISDSQARNKMGCEIVNFSQYEEPLGGRKNTCVELTIKNNDTSEKTITNSGIVAVTKKLNKRNPKGFMRRIKPGDEYQGKVCFGEFLSTIIELKCYFEK